MKWRLDLRGKTW